MIIPVANIAKEAKAFMYMENDNIFGVCNKIPIVNIFVNEK
jgi:hypothetical protein